MVVSIIIPAYNSGKYLIAAVDSALGQTWQDLEVIIIDDNSSDNTWDIAGGYAEMDSRVVRIKNPKNLGVARSRNKGMAAAKGEFIAFLDSDDVWEEDKLERQIRQMQAKNLELCYTAYSFIDENGKPLGKVYNVPQNLTFDALIKENFIGCSTAVFSRRLAGKFSMRSEYMHEDYVFWLEILGSNVRAGGINHPLVLYRKTVQGRSSNKVRAAGNRFEVYRKFLGMGSLKSIVYFALYALRGIRKHYL